MSSLNVTLPSDLHQFVTQRAKDTKHSTPTAYLRTLVKEEKKRVEQQKLTKMLLQGLDSGPAVGINNLAKHFAKKKSKITKLAKTRIKPAGR